MVGSSWVIKELGHQRTCIKYLFRYDMTMSGPILSVKFFHTEAGNEPVRNFLRDLSPEDRKIIGTDIKEVQFGWPLGMPLVRKMEKRFVGSSQPS
ncbi:MAG: hypothetical protein Q7U03_08995 [Syntrophales bacterium]|nr:hypothetical protein [Syntrophales bacterium]